MGKDKKKGKKGKPDSKSEIIEIQGGGESGQAAPESLR